MPNQPRTPLVGFRTPAKPVLERIAAERGMKLGELMQVIVREYVANWPGNKLDDEDAELWAAAEEKARSRGTTLQAELRAFLLEYVARDQGQED